MIALLCLVASAEVPPELFPVDEDLGVEVLPADVWYDALPPEEIAILGLVDAAVDSTVDHLAADGRLKGEGIPWVGFVRDLAKLLVYVVMFLAAVWMKHRRSPGVDADTVAARVVDMLPLPSPARSGPSREETALRAELAALRRDNTTLIDQVKSSQSSSPDETSHHPDAVSAKGRKALRRRR